MFGGDHEWYTLGDAPHANDSFRYAFRKTPFPYPLLRTNGVSPLAVVDVVSYSPSTLVLKSTSTALVNAISSDCMLSGSVVLQGIDTGFVPAGACDPPPHRWNEFRQWSKNVRRRSSASPLGGFKPLIVDQRLDKTDNMVSAAEAKSIFSMVKGYDLQDAYVATVTVSGPRGGVSKFTGVVYGKTQSRVAMVLRFVESIGAAIDLS